MNMDIILFMGIFWSIYGILGLFGIQYIPPTYRGKSWTPDYIRCRGVTWVLVGFPWLVFFLAAHSMNIERLIAVIILIAISTPSILYTVVYDRRYRAMLKNGQE